VLFKAKLLNDFTKFLNLPENKALVGKAFVEVIGKQLSNDAQSQFLAATDNAKELILGKIRSNQLTNPIMTAMLLVMTLRLLLTSCMMKTLVKNLESLKLKSVIWKMYLSVRIFQSRNTAPESIKSLIHLIKVGEEIAKFRSVRNLNENAQIEQYKLDKILRT
jgi:hypothetical protein